MDMQATFSIHVDVPLDLVRVTMAGFFEPADIARFGAARDMAHLQLRCSPNAHLTLVDIRDMNIQPQGSVAGFAALLSNGATQGRRIAFVVGRSLARMQVRRAAEGRDAGFFHDVGDAEAWLLSAEASVAA